MTESQVTAGTVAPSRTRRGRRDIDLDHLDRHLGYFLRRAQVWVFQDFIRTLSAVDIRPPWASRVTRLRGLSASA